MKNIFFSYKSTDAVSIVTSINSFIKKVNNENVAKITSWQNLPSSGDSIQNKVLRSIADCDMLFADVTNLSDNVLFEIGFAISIRKNIWLIINENDKAKYQRFKKFGLLTSINFFKYSNADDLFSNFHRYNILSSTGDIIDKIDLSLHFHRQKMPLLYIKSNDTSQLDNHISYSINEYNLNPIIDDSRENDTESLKWYLEGLDRVPAVLIQFAADGGLKSEFHNYKASFISGLALGLNKKLLLIGPKKFNPPVDIKDTYQAYHNKNSLESTIIPFFTEIRNDLGNLLYRNSKRLDNERRRTKLQRINFGEITAENEKEDVYDYYVETGYLASVTKSNYNMIVGRKGTGKTATLYYLNSKLSKEKINHVCLIKPDNFEMDRLIDIIEKSKAQYVKGFLIQAIWKYLIYTELGSMLYKKIMELPDYGITKDQGEFLEYIDNNRSIFLHDFAVRLDELIDRINISFSQIGHLEGEKYLKKISEIIHGQLLTNLKGHLVRIVDKYHNVYMLVDNLDKSWDKQSDLDVLSKFILGLLTVGNKIVGELSMFKKAKTGISIKMSVFIRADIYSYIRKNAREADKLKSIILKWEDTDNLFRVIEERFYILYDGDEIKKEDLWKKYVVSKVEGEDIKDYICNRILPRPRDILYFFKKAHDIAIIKGHTQIEEGDIIKAYEDYSEWVVSTILVENGITINQMEEFVYGLIQLPRTLSRKDIIQYMHDFDIPTSNDDINVDYFINHLFKLSLIGKETQPGEFRFTYGYEDEKKINVLHNRLGSNKYKIHPAFYPFLEM